MDLIRINIRALILGFLLQSSSHIITSCNLIQNDSTLEQISTYNEFKGNIPVNIRVNPAHYLHGKNYVSTAENLTINAEILDEKFRNISLTYQWSIKNMTITGENISQIYHQFGEPSDDQFIKVLVYHPQNDTGTSQKDLIVREPVSIGEPVGKLFLEHGELLDVTLKFSGTGPYLYCFDICHDRTKSYECKDPCEPNIENQSNQIPIVRYLHFVGNYTLRFTVDNVASREGKSYVIRINEITRPQTLPYVPIVSSISAVLILVIGIALHLKFKQTIFTETANFDFTRQAYDDRQEDIWDEEQTFLQRVRYFLFQADWDTSASMSDSFMSNSRARLV